MRILADANMVDVSRLFSDLGEVVLMTLFEVVSKDWSGTTSRLNLKYKV